LFKSDLRGLYHIPILSKALYILELLQAEKQSVSVEQLHQQTKFSKTSVYRILKTLEHRGYLAHQEDGRYRLVSCPTKLRFGLGGRFEELPFSQAVTTSLKNAAAASGIDLLVLDNRYDARTALRNAEQFVQARVDLVIEFQIDQQVAPIVADKIARAGIPLIAVEISLPHATYFGIDDYRVGFVAGEFLGQHAKKAWKGNANWILVSTSKKKEPWCEVELLVRLKECDGLYQTFLSNALCEWMLKARARRATNSRSSFCEDTQRMVAF
jgi:ribose transport system substrate-binding protein